MSYTRRKVKRGGDSNGWAYYNKGKRLSNTYGRRIWKTVSRGGSVTEARGHRKASVEVSRRDFKDRFEGKFPNKRDFKQGEKAGWTPPFIMVDGKRRKYPQAEYWWAASFWSAKRRTAYDWYVKVWAATKDGVTGSDPRFERIEDIEDADDLAPVTLRLVVPSEDGNIYPQTIDGIIQNWDDALEISAARARILLADPEPVAIWRSNKPSSRQALVVEAGGDE